MRRSLRLPLVLGAAALLAPGLALAHPGHEAGTVMTGVMHPLGGLDHVLAMVAVGLWGAQRGGRALWAAPLAFLAAMVAGGALGLAGVGLPMVEPMILASIVLLGAAVAMALRLPLAAALPAIALFGLAHGHAHGAEGPGQGMAAYALGFVLATAALHGVGVATGLALGRLSAGRTARAIGAATAAAGLMLGFAG